jgi:hypothetical protein
MDTYHCNSNQDHCEAVTRRATERLDSGATETDERRPCDGQEIHRVDLGTVYEKGFRDRILGGAYTVRDEGHTRNGLVSPCWVWTGALRDEAPYIRTFISSYSVRSLVVKRMGMRGRARMKCSTPGCMRPNHMEIESPEQYTARARKHLKPKQHDPKTGRFIPAK